MTDVKFFFLKFRKGWFWSNPKQGYYYSTNIQDQIWEHKGVPCSGSLLPLSDILKNLTVTDKKAERDALMRFNTDYFPLKENVKLDQWNGIIFIDLDMKNSTRFNNNYLVKGKSRQLYNDLYDILTHIASDNFYYIEHSSSFTGIHLMFWFDCEHTRENFFKCVVWCKNLLYDKIHNNEYKTIDDFNIIIREFDGSSGVLDPVYERPYQKCYITGIDHIINDNISGKCDLSNIVLSEKQLIKVSDTCNRTDEDNNGKKYIYEAVYKNGTKKYLTDHNERFRIATALKKVTHNKEEWNILWRQLCARFILYKSYTLRTFYNEFNYDALDVTYGSAYILEKYDFTVTENEFHIDLKDGYLGDKRDEILSLMYTGVNILYSPAGSGKTTVWTEWNKILSDDVLNFNKPVLVIEPMNSIIESKYDDKVITVTGSKKFPKYFTGYSMYVTNYNKLLKKTGDKWGMRDDIDEFFNNFGYIIIDESHLVIKDSFRCDVLIPFIKSINKAAEHSCIILQTATPMQENEIFDLKSKIICYKYRDWDTKWIFRVCNNNKFNVTDLVNLVNYYSNNGRKVYVYWNNASLQLLNSFKSVYKNSDAVAIYHKRNRGDIAMQRINKYHYMEYHGDDDDYKYEVLLSSVYFGVGNDINDEDDAAVIIVGNNPWEEDIQAVSRFRNSKDVEICQIIKPDEIDFVNKTWDENITWGKILNDERNKLYRLWHDKNVKENSIIVGQQSYRINSEDDIEILAVMQASDIYNSYMSVKKAKIQDPYYSFYLKNKIKPLEVNDDFKNELKEYNSQLKNIRNDLKKEILSGKYDYDTINKDTKMVRFTELCKRLRKYELIEKIGVDIIKKSTNYNMLNVFSYYYKAIKNKNIDYPELYALLWYRKMYDINKANDIITTEKDNLLNGVTNNDYWKFIAYIIFIHNKNKEDKDFKIQGNYISKFKWYCSLFISMSDNIISLLYDGREEDVMEYLTVVSDIDKGFSEQVAVMKYEFMNNMDNMRNQFIHMDNSIEEVFNVAKLFFNDKYRHGKQGKKIIITELFNKTKLEKYEIKVGDIFDTIDELCKKCHVINAQGNVTSSDPDNTEKRIAFYK